METYFISDLHGFHSNIIKYCNRPFLAERDALALKKDPKHKISYHSTQQMNDAIINNINAKVNHNDMLWILGDFCFAKSYEYYDVCRGFRERINCSNVNLIWGNHDQRTIGNLFSQTYDIFTTTINKQMVVMCHYPLLRWEKDHRGSWNLFGHIHSVPPPPSQAECRRLDVGVDGHNFQPWHFEEIKEYMDKIAPLPYRHA